MGKLSVLVLFGILMLASAQAGHGQSPPGTDRFIAGATQLKTPFFLDLGIRKYINSFTSYQYPGTPGSVFAPNDPISRLEWPWDQWFWVIRAGAVFDSFTLRGEVAATLSVFNSRKAQDSDWLYPWAPAQKTIFSEGQARPRNLLADFSVSAPVPGSSVLMGVIGYRKQQLRFSYADVLQNSLGGFPPNFPPPSTLYGPDEGISFSQAFTHYYGGGILHFTIELGAIGNAALPSVLLELQADAAYVNAGNVDQHFIRPQIQQPWMNREDTTGDSWHVRLKLSLLLTEAISLNLEGDFLRITTKGSHHHTAGAVTDSSWSGAQVWSDQQYVQLDGLVRF